MKLILVQFITLFFATSVFAANNLTLANGTYKDSSKSTTCALLMSHVDENRILVNFVDANVNSQCEYKNYEGFILYRKSFSKNLFYKGNDKSFFIELLDQQRFIYRNSMYVYSSSNPRVCSLC